jgi:hypothetical protein
VIRFDEWKRKSHACAKLLLHVAAAVGCKTPYPKFTGFFSDSACLHTEILLNPLRFHRSRGVQLLLTAAARALANSIRMRPLFDAITTSLTIAVPLLVASLAALVLQWLRVRRARLRKLRLELPPSSEPPEPSEPWYSLRPRRRRRRRVIRLPPRYRDDDSDRDR